VSDFKNDLRVFAYALDVEGSEYKKTGIATYEMDSLVGDGTKLAPYYTKENPNGLPKWKPVTISGKKAMDKTDFLEFFKNMVLNEIKPKLETPEPVEAPAAAATEGGTFEASPEDDDDLPF
jgi:hypothetical protein